MSGPPVPFSALPLNKDNESAHLNAWGAYGPDDELGFLNRQTDAVVAAAASSEIKTGTRVSLDAPMGLQDSKPLFNRRTFTHTIIHKSPRVVHDDEWHLNTQSSTQWDGLRHFGYQRARRFYNDVTVEDIAGTSPKSKSNPHVLGIQNFVNHGGVVGRGVLVDFARWTETETGGKKVVMDETEGKGFRPFERSGIKLGWLKKTLEYQGTELKFGDILIIRSGWMKAYLSIDEPTSTALHANSPPTVGGVEVTDDLLRWIWDHFSAVAGDQLGFEQIPMNQPYSAHEVLLGGWGCPIGELFDLEELSRTCERLGRWSFFFTSQVVNVPGGVASPPNAIAIF